MLLNRSRKPPACETSFGAYALSYPSRLIQKNSARKDLALEESKTMSVSLTSANAPPLTTPPTPSTTNEPSNAASPSPVFTLRLAAGLGGILLAVLLTGFNEHVTEGGLADLGGALHLGHDEATWMTALFEAFNIAAMAFAPWFAVTFSIRLLSLAAISVAGASALWLPFCPTLTGLLLTRCLQGLACGALPPLLMTVALRYLPPGIKIYGLGAYALTSTFGPNLGIPLTGFLFEYVRWHWLSWEIIPLCVLSMTAIAWGLPQDPLRLERFRHFDWVGLLTGLPAICFLVIGLVEGDRLD